VVSLRARFTYWGFHVWMAVQPLSGLCHTLEELDSVHVFF